MLASRKNSISTNNASWPIACHGILHTDRDRSALAHERNAAQGRDLKVVEALPDRKMITSATRRRPMAATAAASVGGLR
jgi:hypothetical protein